MVALFSQTEGRDELGIGQIRDAFSDLMFPGTSVVQTRARYYLFIPWCYTEGKAAGTSGSKNRAVGENQERRLIKALLDAKLDDGTGLIGSRVGPSVKNLPSNIYWSGMQTYGIRTNAGSVGDLGTVGGTTFGSTELSERFIGEWDPGTPRAPSGFPDAMTSGFMLTKEEAEWLRGRMIAAAPESVLTHLLEQGNLIGDDTHFPWNAVPPDDFEVLEHAYWFSNAIAGAPLLYNLLIAERYVEAGLTRIEDPVDDYRHRIDRWADNFLTPYGADLDLWSIERMWEVTAAMNPNIDRRAQYFVEAWIAGVRKSDSIADDPALRQLIANREKRKGKQSRLLNDKMLATWSGAAGVGQLNFRWGTVRTLVNDIHRGLLSDAGT